MCRGDAQRGGLIARAGQLKVDGGYNFTLPSGWGMRAAGTYDGIGAEEFRCPEQI
jgi:hypothetical protein